VTTATLVFAVLGLVLSVASLVWQAATYTLSGPRVRADLRVGATNGQAFGHVPAGPDWQRQVEHMVAQGMHTPILAVVVRNVGRQATSVTGYQVYLDTGQRLGLTGTPQGTPSLPHRLEAHPKRCGTCRWPTSGGSPAQSWRPSVQRRSCIWKSS
jgi:hypothetical protein